MTEEVRTLSTDTHLRADIRDGVALRTENVHAAATESYLQVLDREGFTQRRSGGAADHRAGVAAFVEKRASKFTGR